MSGKFSIVSSIDLKRIDTEIYEYKKLNGCLEPYLFMSEETARAIETEVGIYDVMPCDNSLLKKYTANGVCATYTGYKVFINNDLKIWNSRD